MNHFASRLVVAFSVTLLMNGCATADHSHSGTFYPPSYSGSSDYVRDRGSHYDIYGRDVGDYMSALMYDVSDCAGRHITITGEYRTERLSQGTAEYHGIHVDYEAFFPGRIPAYPRNWQLLPSSDWSYFYRHYAIPAEATRVILRVGLQGIRGRLQTRNVQVSCS